MKNSRTGSGYKYGVKSGVGCQGGSTFVDKKCESTVKQNVKIPETPEVFTLPFITIKLLWKRVKK